jgi:hypothetical protein
LISPLTVGIPSCVEKEGFVGDVAISEFVTTNTPAHCEVHKKRIEFHKSFKKQASPMARRILIIGFLLLLLCRFVGHA